MAVLLRSKASARDHERDFAHFEQADISEALRLVRQVDVLRHGYALQSREAVQQHAGDLLGDESSSPDPAHSEEIEPALVEDEESVADVVAYSASGRNADFVGRNVVSMIEAVVLMVAKSVVHE